MQFIGNQRVMRLNSFLVAGKKFVARERDRVHPHLFDHFRLSLACGLSPCARESFTRGGTLSRIVHSRVYARALIRAHARAGETGNDEYVRTSVSARTLRIVS